MECKTDLDCCSHEKDRLAWLSLRVWFWMETPPSAPPSGFAPSSAGWSWRSTFQANSPHRHWSRLPRDIPVTVAAVSATIGMIQVCQDLVRALFWAVTVIGVGTLGAAAKRAHKATWPKSRIQLKYKRSQGDFWNLCDWVCEWRWSVHWTWRASNNV